MPLTAFQEKLAHLLSVNRTEDSHLAGGAALHFQPNSVRYSMDLDYFHDTELRVSEAYAKDKVLLESHGYKVLEEIYIPGYVRTQVTKGDGATKVEWAHDSAWRFMPVEHNEKIGFYLHPVDSAINKLLALAGRDEIRDFVDVLHAHENILPLGAMCWAACGKDPGFNPISLLELLKRKGKYRPEDISRLKLNKKLDLHELKSKWLGALSEAELFIAKAPSGEIGCLYYSNEENKFIQPSLTKKLDYVSCHFGKPGGILPNVLKK